MSASVHAGIPPWRRHPREQKPPEQTPPLSRHPREQTSIRSMSDRYASYWNAFLLERSPLYFTCFQVSVHGLVTFSTSERARAFTYTLVTWPNELYPEGADPPFIAPFYAETDFRAGEPSVMEPARLYYRVLTRSTAASDTRARIDTGTDCYCFWRTQKPIKMTPCNQKKESFSVAEPSQISRWPYKCLLGPIHIK